MYLNDTCCCAVGEIQDLHEQSAKENLMDLLDGCFNYPQRWDYDNRTYVNQKPKFLGLNRAHIIFTQASYKGHPRGYGERFKKLIEELKLGTVMVSKAKRNPNYTESHMVKVYVWNVDQKALAKYVKKEILPEVMKARGFAV